MNTLALLAARLTDDQLHRLVAADTTNDALLSELRWRCRRKTLSLLISRRYLDPKLAALAGSLRCN